MAKRKNKVKKIDFDKIVEINESDKPSCFGHKCSFCKLEICGEYWYNNCNYEES